MMARDELDIRQLRALLAVVKHGSLSRAASALQLAQSTMSETIASLDRAIGTPVLVRHRGSRKLELTAAGRALVPHARELIQKLQEARLSVSAVARSTPARVEILTVESLSTYLLPGILRAARIEWPGVRFAVTVESCGVIRAAAERGECDAGLLLEAPPADKDVSVTAHRLEIAESVPLNVFGRPSHQLFVTRRRPVVRLDELTPYTMFVGDGAGPYHDMLVRYLTTDRMPGPRIESAGSVEATRNAVLADESALGILPAYAIGEPYQRGLLRAVVVDPPPPVLRVAAYVPAGGAHPAVDTILAGARRALEVHRPVRSAMGA
jgi:DNA-binding transcriptional LysR family regulator